MESFDLFQLANRIVKMDLQSCDYTMVFDLDVPRNRHCERRVEVL